MVTAATASRRARSFAIVVFGTVCNNANYSLLMPTCWGYVEKMGGGHGGLSLTLAAFSLGRMVALIPVGHWSDRSGTVAPVLCASAIGMAGNVAYVLAPALGPTLGLGAAVDLRADAAATGHQWAVLPVARFVAGLGGASDVALTAWVGRAYPPSRRGKALAINQAVAMLGILMAPALVGVSTLLDARVGPIVIDTHTAPGVFGLLTSLVQFALVGCAFVEHRDESEETAEAGGAAGGPAGGAAAAAPPPASPPPAARAGRFATTRRVLLDHGALWGLACSWTNQFTIAALDTLMTPLLEEGCGLSPVKISFVFVALGLAGLCGAVVAGVFSRRAAAAPRPGASRCARCRDYFAADLRRQIVFGYAVTLVGQASQQGVILTGCRGASALAGVPAVVFGSFLMVFGLLLNGVSNASLYSVATGLERQGVFAGLRSLVMAASRVAGPLAFALWGDSTSRRELFYGVVAADLAMPLLVAPCVWRQLEPFAVKRDPEDKDASIQEPPGADPTPLLDDADERGASY